MKIPFWYYASPYSHPFFLSWSAYCYPQTKFSPVSVTATRHFISSYVVRTRCFFRYAFFISYRFCNMEKIHREVFCFSFHCYGYKCLCTVCVYVLYFRNKIPSGGNMAVVIQVLWSTSIWEFFNVWLWL